MATAPIRSWTTWLTRSRQCMSCMVRSPYLQLDTATWSTWSRLSFRCRYPQGPDHRDSLRRIAPANQTPDRLEVPDRHLWATGYAAQARRSLLQTAHTLDDALKPVHEAARSPPSSQSTRPVMADPG